MGEALDTDPLYPRDILDLREREFPGEHHAGEPLSCRPHHALPVMDRHLGRGVEGEVGDDLPGKRRRPDVLHQNGIDPDLVEVEEVAGDVGEFGITDEDVYGDVDPDTVEVRVTDARFESLVGEVRRVVPGSEPPTGKVDGIGTGGDGCGQSLRRSGRCKQFRQRGRLMVIVRHIPGTVRFDGLYIQPRNRAGILFWQESDVERGMDMDHTGVIGYGHMGGMLVNGFLSSGALDIGGVVVTSRSRESRDACAAAWPGIGIAATNAELARRCRTIVLAVRPQEMKEVLHEIVPAMDGDEHIVSLAAGIGLAEIEGLFAGPVTRVVPTITSTVGKGTTLDCHGRQVGLQDASRVEGLFSSLLRRSPPCWRVTVRWGSDGRW